MTRPGPRVKADGSQAPSMVRAGLTLESQPHTRPGLGISSTVIHWHAMQTTCSTRASYTRKEGNSLAVLCLEIRFEAHSIYAACLVRSPSSPWSTDIHRTILADRPGSQPQLGCGCDCIGRRLHP